MPQVLGGKKLKYDSVSSLRILKEKDKGKNLDTIQRVLVLYIHL
jgi:hypothetical protein